VAVQPDKKKCCDWGPTINDVTSVVITFYNLTLILDIKCQQKKIGHLESVLKSCPLKKLLL